MHISCTPHAHPRREDSRTNPCANPSGKNSAIKTQSGVPLISTHQLRDRESARGSESESDELTSNDIEATTIAALWSLLPSQLTRHSPSSASTKDHISILLLCTRADGGGGAAAAAAAAAPIIARNCTVRPSFLLPPPRDSSPKSCCSDYCPNTSHAPSDCSQKQQPGVAD